MKNLCCAVALLVHALVLKSSLAQDRIQKPELVPYQEEVVMQADDPTAAEASDEDGDSSGSATAGVGQTVDREEIARRLEEQRRQLMSALTGIFGSSGPSLPGEGSAGSPGSFGPGGLPGIFGLFHGATRRNWWEGANVCQTRDEKEEGSRASDSEGDSDGDSASSGGDLLEAIPFGGLGFTQTFTTSFCEESEDTHKCTTKMSVPGYAKTVSVTYQCCHGFARTKDGCGQELELESLAETLSGLDDVGEFQTALEKVGLVDQLASAGNNYTVFAPTDAAMEAFLQSDELNSVIGGEDALKDTMLNHLVPSWTRASQFKDEGLLQTSLEGSAIRTNFYNVPGQGKMVTANCGRVVSSNHVAQNGVTHVVDRVQVPVTRDIMQIISADPQLSLFAEVVEMTGVDDMLRDAGHFTVLAPTNDAFRTLRPSVLARMLEPQDGENCVATTIRNHVLPHVICSSVIGSRARTHNLIGSQINFSRDQDDALLVDEEAKVVVADTMASNGVVHVIDAVLLTDDALAMSEVAVNEGGAEFSSLLSSVGLERDLDGSNNATLFLPTDQAFQTLPQDTRDKLEKDKDYLRSVLKYHMTSPALTTRQLTDGAQLETQARDEDGDSASIAIRAYSTFPYALRRVVTAQCARVVRPNIRACNGVVHLVDQVVLPPASSLLAALDSRPDLSQFARLVRLAGLESELEDLTKQRTLLVPRNAAVESLEEGRLREIEEDEDLLREVVSGHILDDAVCCAGVFESTSSFLFAPPTPRYPTLGGRSSLRLRKNGEGEVVAGDGALVEECDTTAQNGVLHVIDALMLPRQQQQPPHPLFNLGFNLDQLFGGKK